ncbi:phosphatidylinositol 3,4,5-trisphosphate 3-phosphatase and protein-tyrosine-phosphatase PTEN1-like [Camellia sinensis]|uniref:phosphatidylinositol 3,4,5-trisphosphate 3-phosphatase and protein-tyrosine-phosphatase PTEN1-like n=1 Tax=Camellia sinensis TaxID=4442 RepID=UPI00103581ED|nr:phosphatidylinositol 3,4,5-trisphosphate 3-phosphatase and protein-tyrosine-phosphatase PTEN1-like [Camellia sinensis]
MVLLKASKGRTGLMVSAYLVYSGMSAEEALQVYAHKRTTNNEGVSIPSQRRYVGYWENTLSIPRGVDHGPPSVNSPEPCSRELVRIRLYDMVNTGSVFFVVSELQEVPGQRYCPPVEVFKSCCREVKKGCVRPNSSRYYLSFVDQGGEGNRSEPVEPHLVVQMDTESSVLYQKTCLDYCFEKPIKVPYITTALMDAKAARIFLIGYQGNLVD